MVLRTLEVDLCASNPCKNGGSCIKTGKMSTRGLFASVLRDIQDAFVKFLVSSLNMYGTNCQQKFYFSSTGYIEILIYSDNSNIFVIKFLHTLFLGYFCCCFSFFCYFVVIWTLEVDPCTPNPCKNGGHCTRNTTLSRCQCPSGHYGWFCEFFRKYYNNFFDSSSWNSYDVNWVNE